MLPGEPRVFALLPAVGLCSCVVASETPTAAPSHAPALIELPTREPLALTESMIRSGRESLAAGHHAAALQSLNLAIAREPESAEFVYLDMIDAALGLGDTHTATRLIAAARGDRNFTDARRLQSRIVRARELDNARGVSSCEARVDAEPRPLQRVDDPFAAWNLLRSGLPADHAIPIPSSEDQARAALCADGCAHGEPSLARLEGDNEATVALVIAHADGGFSIMPDVLHPVATGCTDETLFAVERHDGLVRVRAFGERLEPVSDEDWHLVELPEYGTPPPSAGAPSYAYAPPSYAYGSSGYPSYASSGYYSYGCGGGYGYGYDQGYLESCQVHTHVERDVILDLDRGEIVLDIVRTGERGSALGLVSMTRAPTGPVVDVEACGVRETLKLSYT